jgi:hypothetical protein
LQLTALIASQCDLSNAKSGFKGLQLGPACGLIEAMFDLGLVLPGIKQQIKAIRKLTGIAPVSF